MVYADYEYYQNNYFGTLPEELFNSQVLKASREIDKNINTILNDEIINSLSEKAQDQLKYTACALTDLIYSKGQSDNKKLSSLSIDGVSKTFKSVSIAQYNMSRKDILSNLPDELTCYI